MSKIKFDLVALAAQMADNVGDMTDVAQGRTLPEGVAIARLIGYVDVGSRPIRDFNTKKIKGQEIHASLIFALWGEGYEDADGNPYLFFTFPEVRAEQGKKGGGKMAGWLKSMRGASSHSNFIPLIGEAFNLPVDKLDAKGVERSNGQVRPNMAKISPIPKKLAAGVPQYEDGYKFMLWESPTLEMWESIGPGEDGEGTEYLQKLCVQALDFVGSPLAKLLTKAKVTIPEAEPIQGAEDVPAKKGKVKSAAEEVEEVEEEDLGIVDADDEDEDDEEIAKPVPTTKRSVRLPG